jgi:hypothetical protein
MQQNKKSIRLTDEEIFEEVVKNIKLMLVSRGIDLNKVETERKMGDSFMLRVPYPQRKVTLVVIYCQTTWIMVEDTLREQVARLSVARARMQEDSERNIQLMLVLKNKPPALGIQDLKNVDQRNVVWIEVFLEEDFYMDKKEYYLNAKSYTRLSPSEASRIADKYIRTPRNSKVAMKQINDYRRETKPYISEATAAAMEKETLPTQTTSIFPTIGADEAMTRYYDIRAGEMVKIITNFTGTICVSYQMCTTP